MCHSSGSGVLLSRIAPVLSLTLHAVLVLACFFVANLSTRAQTLVCPVAYEVALVTLEGAGGSGHSEATAVAVERVESPLPRRTVQLQEKPKVAPSTKPLAQKESKSDPSTRVIPREIAAAKSEQQNSDEVAAAHEDGVHSEHEASTALSNGGVSTGTGTDATSPQGLPLGIGNGLGRGELAGGIGQVDVLPRITRKIEPRYPAGAREGGVTGSVSVKFLVDRNGRVREPQVLFADPQGVFEQSALSAVRRWRFKAAKKDGQRVATWVVLPIRFSLE
ncbi:energy transducer TonB [Desulfovibrio ferrophilus]|uniref:TonB family protein n=1 Tax=Desulfovibrio ferrophilus TaxID=241368 RepID=A0A2Z6B2U2_9BACT|nr:energy transducer TonB [Desulfovibrio ferrophilus]BBD09827.1 TonB family protein [Desulfovibrio ferrophilus]